MGWVFAIAGDMLYYAVIAVATMHLNQHIRDPDTTMWIVLAAMLVVPMIIRAFRNAAGSLMRSPRGDAF
jgi:hypothetical protein